MISKSLPFALGLFLFSVYLLSFSGKFHVMDELAVFTAGHNLAQHGRADINPLIWTNHWTPNPPGVWGRDGHLYTKKPPGISFLTAPLIRLGRLLPGLNAVQVGLLTNALVTALTASLLFVWLTDLKFAPATASLTSLGYGLCTIAWVYARMFWESSLLALFVLGAVWAAYRATRPGGRRGWWLLLAGLSVAVSLTLRFEAVLALVLIALYLALAPGPENGRSRLLVERFTLFLAPSLVVGFGLLYFNYVRFGSFIETGYSQEILFREPWVGAYGLLLSPGRGLFFYSPLLLLLFWGLRPAWRRLPRPYFWLLVALCLSFWLFYGAWFAWGGAWGWGPRFLLPILPLLMLFVAEPIERVLRHDKSTPEVAPPGPLLPSLFYLLILLSLVVNLLGILVDFNEHFLRLGSNENFVFNWAVFPPLAHWQILQEGLVDLIWLQRGQNGLYVEWPVLLPALALAGIAVANLVVVYKKAVNKKAAASGAGCTVNHSVLILALLALVLTYLTLRGAARVALNSEQAQFDLPVLNALSTARPNDVLLVPMPPFGDVQEISTRLMGYLAQPLPTYAWIESAPRAIQPAERGRVWQAAAAEAGQLWLFERWLTPADPPTVTAARLNQEAFPLQEQWFEGSGRLTRYALAPHTPLAPTPLQIPFEGGLTLLDFAVAADSLKPGTVLKLRLTWQADEAGQTLPPDSLIAFVQVLGAENGQKVAQTDRLLFDLQQFRQSPLRPGQTLQQGYGLQLPADLPPGVYSLVTGIYQASSGQRLLRADGQPDDFLYLTPIRIDSK